jgi:hypothetical protein
MTGDKTTIDKTGQIVWHDLFTSDRPRSMAFYERVAGWHYETEHATDFAWGGGEKDFVLALLENEAGAGFAETPPILPNGWIAYGEVADVDVAAAEAEKLGGTIVREPFEVPGVGRNALVRDPLGALVGISLSRHDFPVPHRQFGVEIYLSDSVAFPTEFYTRLFGWTMGSPAGAREVDQPVVGPSGREVAVHLTGTHPMETPATWIPNLKVRDPRRALADAEELGAKPFRPMSAECAQGAFSFLRDPNGATLCLAKR